MRRLKFRRTTLIMVGLGAFLVGLGLGKNYPPASLAYLLIGLVGLVIVIKQRSLITLLICLYVGLMAGWARGAFFAQKIAAYESLYGQRVVVELSAVDDGTYNQRGLLEFEAANIEFKVPFQQDLPGRLKVETVGLPAVFRGDRLEVKGNIYPTGGARQGNIRFANAVIIQGDEGFINSIRLKFIAGMQTALPEPQASLGLGLLMGQRSTLPEDVTLALSAVGLTHIIAVSGYNLTIIVNFVRQKFGRRSKYQILILSIALISLFLLITGFSASIVRAAIVSGLSLGAWYYGRKFRPLLLLLLAAVLTAGWYPIYLWSDIGWYLSFLAFFGVLIVAPLIIKRFWKCEPRGIMPIVVESACAQIMTAPLIMFIFEQASLVALPANMLIVPLVPYAMVFGFVAGIAGMFLNHISAWIALPANLLLAFVLHLVELFARIPNAFISHSLPLYPMIVFYGIITGLCVVLWVKTRPKYVSLTDVRTEKTG